MLLFPTSPLKNSTRTKLEDMLEIIYGVNYSWFCEIIVKPESESYIHREEGNQGGRRLQVQDLGRVTEVAWFSQLGEGWGVTCRAAYNFLKGESRGAGADPPLCDC